MYFFSFSNESTFSQSEKLRILSEISKLSDPFSPTIFLRMIPRVIAICIVNHRKQPSLLTPLTPKLGEGGVRSAT